jgi:hypothetical protein
LLLGEARTAQFKVAKRPFEHDIALFFYLQMKFIDDSGVAVEFVLRESGVNCGAVFGDTRQRDFLNTATPNARRAILGDLKSRQEKDNNDLI